MMASTRRAGTDRGHRVANGMRSADVVGVAAAAPGVGDVGGAGGGECRVGRSEVLRAVPAVLPRLVGAAVDPAGDVPAAHVLEVPLPPRLRTALRRGGRLDRLAAVLSHPVGRV